MSHTIEYYQSMNTQQLVNEMRYAFWAVDRARAKQVYDARMKKQREQDLANSEAFSRLNQSVNNLNSRVSSLTQTNDSLRRLIDTQNRNLTNLQNATNQRIAAMQREYSQTVDRMQRDHLTAMHELENQFETAIDQSERQMEERMNTAIRDSERRTDQLVSNAASALNNRINEVHQEVSRQLTEQQQQINDLEVGYASLQQADQQLRQQAVEYRDAALAVINSAIEYNNANQHSWRQSDLSALMSLRSNVDTDLASHNMLNIGTTRLQARQLFEGAMAYRANVYADEREWQLRHAAAVQRIDEAMINLEASRHIDADGIDIDVDHWTCGDLRRIETQLQELQTLANQPGITNSDLEHISELTETYRQEITRAVEFAMKARQFSFDRKELLEEAVNHITSRFGTIRPEWEEYFAGDERFGYRVYLTSPYGERIVLTAEPVSGDSSAGGLRNQFRYDILSVGSSIHNAQEARDFMQNLESALQDLEGCRFTTAACTNTAAPAQDRGQSNHQVWKNPASDQVHNAARQAAPAPAAPSVPLPQKPAPFQPRSGV